MINIIIYANFMHFWGIYINISLLNNEIILISFVMVQRCELPLREIKKIIKKSSSLMFFIVLLFVLCILFFFFFFF